MKWRYEFREDDFVDALSGMRPFADIYWFAEDLSGNLGVFFSAGFAPIPKEALRSFQAHKTSSSELFQGADSSSFEMYSKKGFFVYDWMGSAAQYQANNPYVQMLRPKGVKHKIPKDMNDCLVKMNVLFGDELNIVAESLGLDLNL